MTYDKYGLAITSKSLGLSGHQYLRIYPTHETAGPTSDKPSTLTTNDVGYQYYSTDLKQPIWWDGTRWMTASNQIIK